MFVRICPKTPRSKLTNTKNAEWDHPKPQNQEPWVGGRPWAGMAGHGGGHAEAWRWKTLAPGSHYPTVENCLGNFVEEYWRGMWERESGRENMKDGAESGCPVATRRDPEGTQKAGKALKQK